MFTADDVVKEARTWIGTPYIHQQRTKGAATDCIGLIYGLYQHFVGPIHKREIVNYSPWWAEEGNVAVLEGLLDRHLVLRDPKDRSPGLIATFALKPGAPIKHAGVLTYDNNLIHAYGRHPVHEVTINSWWDRRIRKVYALPNMEE